MGTGKSSAAIRYMNEHPDDKYIYITPYLDEAARIKNGCSKLDFVEPSDKIPKYNFKKSIHANHLIAEGRNITTTHQAFKMYTQDTLDRIKEHEYTLIIDENVDTLEVFDFHPEDLQVVIDAGYVTFNNGMYSLTDKPYKGKILKELFSLLQSRDLIKMTDKDNASLLYWALPPKLITSFKNVFILTYLFKGQSLHHFMEMYDIPYEYIGVERTEDGGYRFGKYPGYTPEYVNSLKNMIHILDKEKINCVGDEDYSLSMNWFKQNSPEIDRLKNNVSNCFRNIWGATPANKRLWGTYNNEFNKIRGKGYSNAFLTFNAKATNAYRDKECLAYLTNIFMNVNEKTFYQSHGVEVNEDIYSLSIMVQWIWRSAIRDGKEINIYIPSKRMRTLLKQWIAKTTIGGNVIE